MSSEIKKLVLGEGPIPCAGMILGEAPGSEEEKLGRPFVGKSGDLLEEALSVGGIDRRKVYITNVYKLRPPNNRTPTEQEIGSHAMLFHKELTQVDPQIILTLGTTATSQFHSNFRITKIRGKPFKLGSWIILPTCHPSYYLRNHNIKEEFILDVSQFVELAFGRQYATT